MTEQKGIIIQSISGFYYVEAGGVVYECRARGAFRREGVSPLVGDTVDIETQGEKGTVVKIYDRKNSLTRPPVANIDRLFIVASADCPKPNIFVIDKMSAFAVYHGIEPIIVFSKNDLADTSLLAEVYRQIGMTVISCSAVTGDGVEKLADAVKNKSCAFTGNSGVGKSSIINAMEPELKLATNEISEKLGRGRHTTRSVSLYHCAGGLIADTPGFSSFEQENGGVYIAREELADCFPEFAPLVEACRFYPSCSHTVDKGCAVCEAVKKGILPRSRHESYCRMYEEVKKIKPWEQQ